MGRLVRCKLPSLPSAMSPVEYGQLVFSESLIWPQLTGIQERDHRCSYFFHGLLRAANVHFHSLHHHDLRLVRSPQRFPSLSDEQSFSLGASLF